MGIGVPDDAPVATLLDRLVRADLVGMTGLDRLMRAPNRLGTGLIRQVILGAPNPTEWFEGLWTSREVALSRDRRWREDGASAGYDGCNAALVAVAMGIAAATPIGEASDLQRALFVVVSSAVSGQVLAPTRGDPGFGWQSARRACAALWPRLALESGPSSPMPALQTFLGPFARPTETFAWDLVELTRAGVSCVAIERAVWAAGHDLVALLDAILSDAWRRGESSRLACDELGLLEALGRDAARVPRAGRSVGSPGDQAT